MAAPQPSQEKLTVCPGRQPAELGSGTKNRTFTLRRRQQARHRAARRNPIADDEVRVVDATVPRRRDRALPEPPIGLRQRLARRIARRPARRGSRPVVAGNFAVATVALSCCTRASSLLSLHAHVVERRAADETRLEQRLLALEIRRRQLARRHAPGATAPRPSRLPAGACRSSDSRAAPARLQLLLRLTRAASSFSRSSANSGAPAATSIAALHRKLLAACRRTARRRARIRLRCNPAAAARPADRRRRGARPEQMDIGGWRAGLDHCHFLAEARSGAYRSERSKNHGRAAAAHENGQRGRAPRCYGHTMRDSSRPRPTTTRSRTSSATATRRSFSPR